mmetsp:Transcript_337/g.965  ORF Transcript_337/g.965 Transcript_337/m.965 type:complete len:290 (-) Transcript_337:312-1181(-)
MFGKDDGRVGPVDPALRGQIIARIGLDLDLQKRNAIARGKAGDPAHIAVYLAPDQGQPALRKVHHPPPPRGKNRDDNVGHLGDIRHQLQHIVAAYTQKLRVLHGPPTHKRTAPVQKRQLAKELTRLEGRIAIAFTGGRIHRFGFSGQQIMKGINTFTDLLKPLASGHIHHRAHPAQRGNMVRRQRRAHHRIQISGKALHRFSPVYPGVETEIARPTPVSPNAAHADGFRQNRPAVGTLPSPPRQRAQSRRHSPNPLQNGATICRGLSRPKWVPAYRHPQPRHPSPQGES